MSSKQLVFSHYFDWNYLPDNVLPCMLAQVYDAGVRNLVFCDKWITRILREPAMCGFFRELLRNKFCFADMHAPYGECYDLACLEKCRRDDVVKDHIRAMGYASDFGCRSYTIHIGAFDSVFFHKPNEEIRPFALDTLEKLIPAAEKYGIVIAVENSFERSNTPEEVMYYVNAVNHPNVGCCFDSGHALVMDTYPGKGAYGSYMTDDVWSGRVENFSKALEFMAPAMVTCHLHDNDGFSDQHLPPGNGIENWEQLAGKLLTLAPKLMSIQSEAMVFCKGLAVTDAVRRFRRIFPDLA